MGLKTGPKWAPFWTRFGALMPQSGTLELKGLASDLAILIAWNAILHCLTTRPETGLKGRFQGTGGLWHPGGANSMPQGRDSPAEPGTADQGRARKINTGGPDSHIFFVTTGIFITPLRGPNGTSDDRAYKIYFRFGSNPHPDPRPTVERS